MEEKPARKPRWDEQPLVPVEQRSAKEAYVGNAVGLGLFGVLRARKKRRQYQQAQEAKQQHATEPSPPV